MEIKNTLIDQLSSVDHLYESWNLLKKENEDSHGLSGLTIEDFKKKLDSNIENISKELKNKSFRFSRTRAAIIKKDNGKYRPLQIPEIRDRLVLKAISILLDEQLSNVLSASDDVSFAYQKGKGVRDAVLKMKMSYFHGDVILKADIINFFEEIKKDKLLNELIFPNLKDSSINELIAKSMSQKLGGLNRLNKKHHELFKNVGAGIPQGNPLSPLLSNVYLSTFDKHVKKIGYQLVRYADDFIVVFKSIDEAQKGYEVISTYLKKQYSLNIHPLEAKNGKTEIINPLEEEISFLSIKFDGANIYPSKDSLDYLKSTIRKFIKEGDLNKELFINIYKAINKWIAIYSYLDIDRYFTDLDAFLLFQLKKKFGEKHYNPKKCYHLANNIRTKQYNKSSKSFWRKVELTKILPKFRRRKKTATNTVHIA